MQALESFSGVYLYNDVYFLLRPATQEINKHEPVLAALRLMLHSLFPVCSVGINFSDSRPDFGILK